MAGNRGRAGVAAAAMVTVTVRTVATLRALDLMLALLLLTLLAPLWLLRALLALIGASRVFDRIEVVGRHHRPFTLWVFAGPLPGRDLAALFNILRGDLAFAGPRPLTPAEAAQVPAEAEIALSITVSNRYRA